MTLDLEDIEAIANAVVRKIGFAGGCDPVALVKNTTVEERKRLAKAERMRLKNKQI